AAGVDAHRAAAEQRDRAVGLDRREVAGHGVALAVGGRDPRGLRLLRILVVADRDVAAPGDFADHTRAGFDRLQVVVEDDRVGPGRNGGTAALHGGGVLAD